MRIGDITRPVLALAKDAERAESAMDAENDGYARRNYVRAIFAMIEGSLYVLKQVVLEGSRMRPGVLSVPEIVLLEECTYEIDRKGLPKTVTKYIKLPDNLRFTARCFLKITGCELRLPVGQTGWEELARAISVRNRIMHPKSLVDIDVSEDEAETVRRVSHWFNEVVVAAVAAVAPRSET